MDAYKIRECRKNCSNELPLRGKFMTKIEILTVLGAVFPHFCPFGPLPHAKFHVYWGSVSPLWGEKPIFRLLSKNNTGIAALQWKSNKSSSNRTYNQWMNWPAMVSIVDQQELSHKLFKELIPWNIRSRTAAILKIVFGHNLVADFSEILRGEAILFTQFGHWDRYPRCTERVSCFSMQFGFPRAGAFRIVSDNLVYFHLNGLERKAPVIICPRTPVDL